MSFILGVLSCDMVKGCPHQVSHIDSKGYVYCAEHGAHRKQSHRCRRLTPSEIRKLSSGQPLECYSRARKATQ